MLTSMARLSLTICLALVAGGCFPPADVPRPTPSLPAIATPTAAGSVDPGRTPLPTLPPWPTGWDAEFCGLFAELVTVTELAVDIEPTISEGPRRDARGLANELATTPGYARRLLDDLAGWPDADALKTAAAALLDTAEQAGQRYVRYLVDGRKRALPRARELLGQLREPIDQANDALELLAAMGLVCPDHGLQLEQPSSRP